MVKQSKARVPARFIEADVLHAPHAASGGGYAGARHKDTQHTAGPQYDLEHGEVVRENEAPKQSFGGAGVPRDSMPDIIDGKFHGRAYRRDGHLSPEKEALVGARYQADVLPGPGSYELPPDHAFLPEQEDDEEEEEEEYEEGEGEEGQREAEIESRRDSWACVFVSV